MYFFQVPKFVSRANCEEMHKLLDLKNFAIYFDTNTTLVGDLKKTDMQVCIIIHKIGSECFSKQCTYRSNCSGPEIIKELMLNSAEQENFMLINVKMPTIVAF